MKSPYTSARHVCEFLRVVHASAADAVAAGPEGIVVRRHGIDGAQPPTCGALDTHAVAVGRYDAAGTDPMRHPIDPLLQQQLDALRARMKRNIKVPSSVRWRADLAGPPTVVATMDAAALESDFQKDDAAAPCFALCLAWWFERYGFLGGGPVHARVELPSMWTPTNGHGFRSAVLLRELARLLPGRFAHTPPLAISWPDMPILNAAIDDRDATARPEKGGEHAIEVAFTRQADVPAQFAPIDAVDAFQRQLPLGLFNRTVSRNTRWSPGGASQVDLWTRSRDGRTVHLFELKDAGNCKVGIIPEALWYARLLHAVRVGDFGGHPIAGGGPTMDVVRRAERIAMWLLVQDTHPLVRTGDDSPLAWLRAAMKSDGVALGVLPYEYYGGTVRLRPDLRWE